MDETIKKSDLENLQKTLQEEIRTSGARLGAKIDDVDQRLGAKIDDVDQRLGAKIDEVDERLGAKIDTVEQRLTAKIGEVDERLDAKMDVGFGMVARQFVETEERLKRHTDVRFDALREDIRSVAEGVVAVNERLDRYIQQNEAEHTRLDRAFLAGEAALDARVTALEKRAPG